MSPTIQDLREKQSWTLMQKIDHSLSVIEAFLAHTNSKAYVSFSGGKDSTVLLRLCRIIKPDIKAVFCNTGVEFPDIVKFVRQTDNVKIIRPEKTIKQIIAEYGFPLVSKNASQKIWYSKHRPNTQRAKTALGSTPYSIANRWMFLIDKTYDTSEKCCTYLKKRPFEKFEKETKLHPIMGTMTDESFIRQTAYLQRGGCNSFVSSRMSSNPLSIWTEQDVWDYIKMQNIEIAEIYHKGARRTGCVGCGFGAYNKDDYRFELLHDLYPRFYNTFMNYTNNGVTYREALRDMLAVTGRYLPDEQPLPERNLFSELENDNQKAI